MDASLATPIQTPRLEQAAVSMAHMHNAYLPTIQAQAQTIGTLQAHIDALTSACEQQATQNKALVFRVLELEAKTEQQTVTAVADEIAAHRNGKGAVKV